MISLPILPVVFFASGASALAFETLWFRQAGLAVGNGVWASSLVLSAFMTGLGVGSWLALRRGDRVARPLRAYAALEAVIAASGVALVFGLPRLGSTLAPLLDPLLDVPLAANAIRFAVAFVALLPPSIAMGATLPLLTRALDAMPGGFGVAFGLLYGCNTLGAVVGPLLTEGALIPAFGIRGSALAAGAASLAIALAALALDRGRATVPPPAAIASAPPPRAAIASALAAVFGSGFALLALEVLWFRVLLLYVSGSSFAFALMLSTVLAGIGIGSVAASFWLRAHPDAWRNAAGVAFVAGLGSAACYALYPWITAGLGTRVLVDEYEIAAIGAALTMPTAAASGVLFALLGARLRRELGGDAATAGSVTLANTAGAALGSLAAGFVLLPALGTQYAVLAVAVVYAAIGLLLRPATLRRAPLLALGGAFAVALAVLALGSSRDRMLDVAARRWATTAGATLLAKREGLTETLFYLQGEKAGLPGPRLLVTNTFAMSGTGPVARRYMKFFVLWPAAVHPDLESALLISYGVGSTARALVDVPSLRHIDVVDVSRDVLEMSDLLYPDPASHPLRDPRVSVHVEDGRHFLQMRDRRYDLITGEPPPPQVAGVVNLYTQEYFALMRERLAEGGIVTYWLPTHSLDAGQSRAILKAFCNVFEDCSLWSGSGLDLVMIGTRGARGPVSEASFTRAWRNPALATELRAIGFDRPEMLGATFIGDADYLRSVTIGTAPLVDDHPERLSRVTAIGVQMPMLYRAWRDVDANRARFEASALIPRLWPERLRTATLPYFDVQAIVNRGTYWMDVADRSTLEAADTGLAALPGSGAPLWVLGSDLDLVRFAAASVETSPALELQRGIGALVDGRPMDALGPLARAAAADELRERALLLRAYASCRLGRTEDARDGSEVFARDPSRAGEDAASWRWLTSKCSQLARRESLG